MANAELSNEELRGLYDRDYVDRYNLRRDRRVSRLVPEFDLTGDQVVADFACGNGFLLDCIHDRVKEYYGVDFSAPFIDAARARAASAGILNATFECREIVEFCRANPAKFDRAFTLDFSEHVYDPAFVEIYRGIRGALKPGGVLYLHTPNGEYFLEILKARGILEQFPDHVAVRAAPQYVPLLKEAGFSQIEIRTLPHYVPSLSRLHWLSKLPGLGRYWAARLLLICR